METLKLEGIYKSFNEIKILENINFSIAPSQTVGLFGPSGCGKSTLLYIASCILASDTGKISVMGKEILTEQDVLFARRNHFGFIYQFHNLIPELNVFENILIAQGICGKIDKSFINFLLNELGIYEKAKSSPQTLSGGEAQRVAVARAFASKPSIVFADEPTGNLDPETAEKTINLITNLAKLHNSALLVVTHNYSFLEKFDKAFEIKNHQLLSKK